MTSFLKREDAKKMMNWKKQRKGDSGAKAGGWELKKIEGGEEEKGNETNKVWDAVKKRRKWGKGGGGCRESESLSSQKFVVLIGGANPAKLTNLSHKPVGKATCVCI